MKRSLRLFQRLQWKLTFSYTLTTVLALLLVEIVAVVLLLEFTVPASQPILPSSVEQQAQQAATYFIHGSPDRAALTDWLSIKNQIFEALIDPRDGFITIVDTQGLVLASKGSEAIAPGVPLSTKLSAQDAAKLEAVLRGKAGSYVLSNQEPDGRKFLVAPIISRKGQLLGALVTKSPNPLDQQTLLVSLLPSIVIILIVFTICAGLAGTLFGFLTARGFTRRFKRLSTAADNWSNGNFAVYAQDSSGDELGQLTRQLNRMVEQLQNLLLTRQKLASLEERNRLARDLHDSVKQQVFAVSMQISTAKALLTRDVDAAQARLAEAERLVRQAQQELTSLIRELRPVALEGKGLVAALQELVSNWSHQTGISADVRIEMHHMLPLATEEALYRVAQEALANVVRHSKATAVQVQLTSENSSVTLRLSDNGQGFDVAARNGQGVGLLSMRERMKALHGDVDIESTSGKGTLIRAHCTDSSISV